MRAAWIGWFGVVFSACANAVACTVRLDSPHRTADGWTAESVVEGSGLLWVGVDLKEEGEDWVLELGDQISDVAPSRYAVERVGALHWNSGSIHVTAKGFDAALTNPPPWSAHCTALGDADFVVRLMWSALVYAVRDAQRAPTSASTRERRRHAIDVAKALRAVEGASDWALEATQVEAFEEARDGRHADALRSYRAALELWQRRETGARAAVRFAIAKEQLALGNAISALTELDALLSPAVRAHFAPVWIWASNDRCAALRMLGQRDEAVECMRSLVPEFDAMLEPKEAANTLCNLGAALGVESRWSEASPTLVECSRRRAALRMPGGMAHAELLLGWEALETTSVNEAISHLERSVTFAAEAHDAGKEWDARRWLARAWLVADEGLRARKSIEDLVVDGQQDPMRSAQRHVALAHVAAILDQPSVAVDHLTLAEQSYRAAGQAEGLNVALCLHAWISVDQPIPEGCDSRTAGEILWRRGDTLGAVAALSRPVAGAAPDILRRVLLVLAGSTMSDRAAIARLVVEAQHLPVENPSERSARGELLARIAFELAALSDSRPDDDLEQLAFDAAWHAGSAHAGIGAFPTEYASPPIAVANVANTLNTAREKRPKDSVEVASVSFLGDGYLLVAHSDDVVVERVDLPLLRRATERWRDALIARRPADEWAKQAAIALRLDRWLRPDDSRLALRVHSFLSELPWAALPVPGVPPAGLAYRPLADQATVVQEAPRVMPGVHARLAHAIDIIALATDELPGVGEEQEVVSSMARQKGWIVDENGTGGVVHVSGHAVADRILGTGGGFGGLTDGWLPRTQRPQLVVLAGCETGIGASSRWQSSASMARRTLDAGVEEVVAHLWPIADGPAVELHRSFYRHLLDGERVGQAIQSAQKEVWANPARRHPYYWASFVHLARAEAVDP